MNKTKPKDWKSLFQGIKDIPTEDLEKELEIRNKSYCDESEDLYHSYILNGYTYYISDDLLQVILDDEICGKLKVGNIVDREYLNSIIESSIYEYKTEAY